MGMPLTVPHPDCSNVTMSWEKVWGEAQGLSIPKVLWAVHKLKTRLIFRHTPNNQQPTTLN